MAQVSFLRMLLVCHFFPVTSTGLQTNRERVFTINMINIKLPAINSRMLKPRPRSRRTLSTNLWAIYRQSRFEGVCEMTDVFQIEPLTEVDQTQSYIRAYPHILAALKTPQPLDEQAFVCGAHMVYGWMPTILAIHVSKVTDAHAGAALLNKARTDGRLDNSEIEQLAGLINRSVVGASKLLHFVNPEAFAIWDSKIYRFLHQKPAYHASVNNVDTYASYLGYLRSLMQDPQFPGFHSSVNRKMGYPVSPLRALEVVMFLNAPARKKAAKQKAVVGAV